MTTNNTSQPKSYEKPTATVLGRMTDLTQGGGGSRMIYG